MGIRWLWRSSAIVLVPNVGISSGVYSGEKSFGAFDIGRLEWMSVKIVDIVLESKDIFGQGNS